MRGNAGNSTYLIRVEDCSTDDPNCPIYELLTGGQTNGWLVYWLPYLISAVVFVGVAPLIALAAYNLYYKPQIYKKTFTKRTKIDPKFNVDF